MYILNVDDDWLIFCICNDMNDYFLRNEIVY